MSGKTLLLSLAALAWLGAACAATDDDAVALGSGDFDASAQALMGEFEPVPAGSYVVETLGTPFSLTVGDDWFVQVNSDAGVVLTDPASRGPGDRDVVFMRPTDLSAPAEPTDSLEEQEFWPVDDIEGWLENVVDGVVVSDVRQASLGGSEALAFDLELVQDFECGPDSRFCALFFDIARRNGKALDRDFDYRVWWVDDGQYEPIAVVVGAGPSDTDFFETAETLLSTIAFGPPAPHPIQGTGQ